MKFEEYLRDYVWEPEGILDDDMPDAFDDWLSEIDMQEVMDYADFYGNKCFKQGKLEGFDKAVEILKDKE